MTRHITDEERRSRLALRHRLVPAERTDDVTQIVDDVVALHSSDPATVFLSVAVRMVHPSVEVIEAALYEDRTLLRHHAMRRTLWVMTPETARRAHASSTEKILGKEVEKAISWLAAADGVDDPARWFEESTERLIEVVRRHYPITTREVGVEVPDIAAVKLVAAPGTRNAVGVKAHSRLLMLAAFEGRLVRTAPVGTWISSQYRWAPIEDWHVDRLDTMELREAAAGMLDHYLRRFGPATETDLAWWTGWTKTQVRQALADIDAEQVTLDGDGAGWVAAGDAASVAEAEPWVAVLPGLDVTTMGWKERDFYLDPALVPRLFDRNGNAGPTIWMDGRVVGGWAQRPDGTLALDLPKGFPAERRHELDAEIDRLRDFIGDIRFRPRFPSPNQKELLSDRAAYERHPEEADSFWAGAEAWGEE